ncbi:Antiviral helicase ski2 [Xanthoria parietina]
MELLDAIEKLQLKATSLESQTDELLCRVKEETQPKKLSAPSQETLKQDLEAAFLQPPTALDNEWLNRLQQRWEIPTDLTSLFELAPTQTRSRIRFIREGLEGKVTGYKEVTVPATSATAKNSTSFLRRPANRADFVRGAAGFFPFAPGGLDDIQAVADSEDRHSRGVPDGEKIRPSALDRVIEIGPEKRLLEVPPGFTRGLRLDRAKTTVDKTTASQIEESLSREPTDHEEGRNEPITNVEAHSTDDDEVEVADAERDAIDDLLPVEFAALQPHGILAASTTRRGGREWAHMVDVKREITNFGELVPEMARTWPFELDTFQKEAVYHLESGDSVFVAAHTSAGKTVVAEYAIALAAKHMTKAVYTSPIKALSNQKFRDFRQEFDDVGILTGDVQINPEASCLIMTTEILRSMLYRGADLLRDVEYVIFDEVHYVNDIERGVVWEEVIIMLPEHVTLILLSATVPNTYEFASWVGRTKKKDVYVISTPKRPVPLEHFLWADKAMHKIVDANKKFLDQGWKEANVALSGRDSAKTVAPSENATPARGGTNARGRGQAQRGGTQKPGGQRGRGQPQRGGGNIARTGRGGGRTTAAQDRNVWVHLVQHLRKHELLPACIFVFSKNRCEQNADALSNLDFCTASEKSATHMIIERSIARLKPDDRMLPQIRRLRELLSRGIAVHHGGLLPIVKEIVEILFAKTLVKVLFATETFAMGLNLPTRTVVFSGFRKHDGRTFRELLPGEYTQMAGRAGRRGLDPVGSVIIVNQGSEEAPPAATLKQMILGDPTKLRSQFRLTYNMILNLLRVEALKIEEMIKRSFSENATQALLPQHEKHVKLSESDLAKIKREQCDVCDGDLVQCHKNAIGFQSATVDLHLKSVASPIGRRMISAKRLIVLRKDDVRTMGILLRDNISRGPAPTIEVLSMSRRNPSPDPSDLLPYLPKFRRFFAPLPSTTAEIDLEVLKVALNDVECFTKTLVKINLDGLLKHREESKAEAKAEIARICASWQSSVWDELDWNRLRDLNVRDTLELRSQRLAEAEAAECIECPQFVRHFSMCHSEWLIQENINQLKQRMSDQNLQLLPDYEQRVEVLKDLGFIDMSSRVQLKGKVACEIHSADELVLTELILENVLADFEPEEMVALLSAFVFQEKTDVEPTLSASLEKGKATIIEISEKVNAFQIQHQVILSSDDSNDFVSRPRFGLVEVVHEWARGMSFNRITDLTDVLEGTIVRVITRLDETCREVKNAARIIGDPQLFTKMQSAQEMIKRDITAVASLYM